MLCPKNIDDVVAYASRFSEVKNISLAGHSQGGYHDRY